ncbi:MAG: pyridoxal phosphate-dependent aminotransferase [Oligoflexales bacterium]
MRFSERIQRVQPSPTLTLNSRARDLKSQGLDILNFAVGEPDYGTPKAVVDIGIEALQQGQTRYGPAGGSLDFKNAVCTKVLRDQKIEIHPQQVVAGVGAKELLFHTFQTLLNDGDEVLIHAPAWVSYMEQIKLAGGTPVMIPLELDEQGEVICTPEQLAAYATPKTRAFILCSPNNPAGYTLSQSSFDGLVSFLEKTQWWVISDEIYEAMSFDRPHLSVMTASSSLSERTVTINGCSKAFAMTGWRVGYAIGPKDFISHMKNLQSHSSSCLPPFVEKAAIHAIEQGPAELMKTELQHLKEKRIFAAECLKNIPYVRAVQNHGTFYLFVDCNDLIHATELDSSMSLSLRLLEQHHVAVVPGEAFMAPGYLRFSFATDRSTIQKGFDRLKDCVMSLVKDSKEMEK